MDTRFKPGDKVIVNPWFGGLWVETVIRLTPKTIVVTGHNADGTYKAKPWDVYPATPENLARLAKWNELEVERFHIKKAIMDTGVKP